MKRNLDRIPDHEEVSGTSSYGQNAWPIVSLVAHPDFFVGNIEDNPVDEGNVGAATYKQAKGKADGNRKKRNQGRA